MNNLNNGAGTGDWDPWKYALLVPMVAVGACRWIWEKESQRKIQKIEAQCDKDVSAIKSEMQLAVATLQQEVDKERQRAEDCNKRKDLEVWYIQATNTLSWLETQLMERQHVYCSHLLYRDQRLEIEKNMLLKVAKDPIGAELDLESDLEDIFKKDKLCADLLNVDKKKNGRLMWTYLEHWHKQVEKHKIAKEAMLEGKSSLSGNR